MNEHYAIKDLYSKKGTFLWVDREHSRKIEVGDSYLVAKMPLVITRAIQLPKATIDFSYDGKDIKIGEGRKVFLIGSH